MIKRSGARCCDSSMIARCNPCPCPKIMTWRTTRSSLSRSDRRQQLAARGGRACARPSLMARRPRAPRWFRRPHRGPSPGFWPACAPGSGAATVLRLLDAHADVGEPARRCCRARGTEGNWTRVDRKMVWSPAASSSQQRARVLTDVKARRFAPPPLRGADGLDVGSAHACPAWLLPTMPTHTPPTCCGRRPVQNDALSSDR